MDLFFEERLTMTESSNKAACILIVEDEAAIRTLISFACAAAGYEVKCAESAIKAQSIVDNNPPDLVSLLAFKRFCAVTNSNHRPEKKTKTSKSSAVP